MSIANQYYHQGLFQRSEKQGARRKPWFSRSRDSSSATRASYSDIATNHPHPMVAAHNPNIEMSQISQLSMDSSFGTNSHSTNFPDNFPDNFPLRQPSGSVASNSQGHSHSSQVLPIDDFKYQHQQYHQSTREAFPSSKFPSRETREATVAHDTLHESIGSSSSFLSRTQRKPSLLQTKKKQKRKQKQKTRFAGTSNDDGPYTRSQGSLGASSTLSASASKSSSRSRTGSLDGRTRSGNLYSVLNTARSVRSAYDRIHSDECIGDSSHHPPDLSHHPPQKHLRRQNVETSFVRPGMDANCHHGHRGSNDARVLMPIGVQRMSNDRQTQVLSIIDRTFAKAATPRKKLNVPYPLLESELHQKQQHELRLQQTNKTHGDDTDLTTTTMTPIQVTQRGPQDSGMRNENKTNHERMSGQNDERDKCLQGITETTVGTNGIAPGNSNTQEDNERVSGREQNSSHNATPVPGRGIAVDPSKAKAILNEVRHSPSPPNQRSRGNESKTISMSTAAQEREPIPSELDGLEAEKKRAMADFKKRLEDVLKEMESKAKSNFHDVLQTATCATETKLKEKALLVQEATQSELDRKSKSILKATQSDLERKAEQLQEMAQSKLDQKRGDLVKSTEDLFELNRVKLEETSSKCVEKLESCAEGSLAKLSKFTETWLADSCNAIVTRLKPYLYLTSETNAPSKDNFIGVVGKATREQTREEERHSDITCTDSDPQSRKSSTSQGSFHETFPVEGEVSLSQASRSKGSKNSEDNKAPLRPLRRSKRMRKSNSTKIGNSIDKSLTPGTHGESIEKSNEKVQINDEPCLDGNHHPRKPEIDLPPVATSNDKVLCVTPTGGASGPKKESFRKKQPRRKQKRPFPEPDEPSTLPLRKCKQKCAHMSPTRKTRSETHRGLHGNDVPNEITAYGNCNLSPLEEPKPMACDKTKRLRCGVRSKSTHACKSKIFSSTGRTKRRKGGLRTYAKRGGEFDVTEKDDFNF